MGGRRRVCGFVRSQLAVVCQACQVDILEGGLGLDGRIGGKTLDHVM